MVTGVTGKEAKDWASNTCGATAARCTPRSAGSTATTSTTQALRALVRHCLVELDQDGIWLTGGIAEFWSLTTDELKEVVRVAIEEARRVKPGALVQVMSSTDTAKQAVELTLNAQELGADICYILTPVLRVLGQARRLEYLRYVADRTDMPLGFFNSHSTGLILTPEECVELYREFPALCGLKNGLLDAQHSLAIHQLAPEMVLWEAADEAGIRLGIPHPGALGFGALPLREAGRAAVQRMARPAGARRFRARRHLRGRDRFDRHARGEPPLPVPSRPPRNVHALGSRIQIRRLVARPPRRRPPGPATADCVPRRPQAADPSGLRRLWVHRVLRTAAVVEVREFRAGVRAWIDEVGDPLVAGIEDQSVQAQLDHQRRVQRMLFDAGWMRWGWPTRIGGLGGSPILRAVLGEELTSRALVHTTSWSMHEVLGPAVAEFGRPNWSRRSSRSYCAARNSGVRGFLSPKRVATWDRCGRPRARAATAG